MSKITDYLNSHLVGEVLADANTRLQYSTDGSILNQAPHLVVHPRVVDDVRKIARFTWRLAERGQVLPLSARGNGTDPTGAAINRGITVSFPAHMAELMEFDIRSRLVRVQAGMGFGSLNQALATHGMELPVDNGMSRVATIGGALSTNMPGRRYGKYGTIRDWTSQLEVVLANGEVIQTGRLSKRELNEKKGLQTLEGEIYRSIDSLIDDNPDIIASLKASSSLDAGGYAIDLVKDDSGGFDLTPLLIGSQGTLGIITQCILQLKDLSDNRGVVVAALGGDYDSSDLINRLMSLEPSALEFIDGGSLKLIEQLSGYAPWSFVTAGLPSQLLFIEFDDKRYDRRMRKAGKVLESIGVGDIFYATDPADVELCSALYDSVSVITNADVDGTCAIPLVTDLAVSPDSVFDVVDGIRASLARNHTKAGVWGNVASGLITVRPLINLANLGQRQVVFRLLDDLNKIVQAADGSITGCNGQGRLLDPIARTKYDADTADLFGKIKKTFDPYGVLNTGVKSASLTREDLSRLLRQDYRNNHFYQLDLRG